MRAGELRNRITIERPIQTTSTSGEVSQTWQVVATVWAKIEPISGSEIWRTAQVDATLTHAITIRYLAGVSAKYRVKFIDPKTNRTRYFGINAVLDLEERGVQMNLACTESDTTNA